VLRLIHVPSKKTLGLDRGHGAKFVDYCVLYMVRYDSMLKLNKNVWLNSKIIFTFGSFVHNVVSCSH
jgi:hypothetical protein